MIRVLPLLGLALAGCTTVPPNVPPTSDDVYRAVGTEPFWSLIIAPDAITFREANSSVPVIEKTPRPIIAFAGEIYQTPRIGVNIVHTRCSDGMSDRVYPDKIQLRVDDRSFEGCGGQPLALATTP